MYCLVDMCDVIVWYICDSVSRVVYCTGAIGERRHMYRCIDIKMSNKGYVNVHVLVFDDCMKSMYCIYVILVKGIEILYWKVHLKWNSIVIRI